MYAFRVTPTNLENLVDGFETLFAMECAVEVLMSCFCSKSQMPSERGLRVCSCSRICSPQPLIPFRVLACR